MLSTTHTTTPSPNDLINIFKPVLASHCTDAIKAIWDGNEVLRNWYLGKQVNFGTIDVPNVRVISINDLINIFMPTLASRCTDTIKAIWDGNEVLRNWYLGKQVNFGTIDVPNVRVITMNDLISIFKSALASHCTDVIKAMWDGNESLRACCLGKQVNFGTGTGNAEDVRVIFMNDLISIFKSALASRCTNVIKAMWNENESLRDWYLGKQVNFGTGTGNAEDVRVISIEDLISHFQSALASHCKDVINAIWKSNKLLRNWYSGKQVDFGTGNAEDVRVISIKDLISHFQSALASRRQTVIKAMWNGNPLLRAWYLGKQVNFGTIDVQDVCVISMNDLISIFKSALASRCTNVINAMWNENESLRDWYLGKQVNFGTGDAEDVRVISIEDLISIFKSALASRCSDVIKTLWNGNEVLRIWYKGEQVNFGTGDAEDVRVISIEDLISHFKSALASHCNDIIKTLWNENSLLCDWYSGRRVNFSTNDTEDVRVISINDLISIFKSALASRCPDVINSMWNENESLRDWYLGKQVNFGTGTGDAEDVRVISIEDLISHFKSALASRCTDVINAMWNGNELLRERYRGKQGDFSANNIPDVRAIHPDALISHFKSALASQTNDFIVKIWDENQLLRDWYSGRQVDFGAGVAEDVRVISIEDLISHFKSALASHCKDVINVMWNENESLRDWYHGKQVNFGTRDAEDVRVIPTNELISNFKSALASLCKYVVNAIWRENQNLRNAIRGLDFNESKLLLHNVMSSDKHGKSRFITLYLIWVDNADLIQATLEDIKQSCKDKPPSTYKKNQINALQKCLDKSRPNEIPSEAFPQEITQANSETAPTPISRKRKATSKTKSIRKKMRRKEMTQLELSEVVSKLPPELNGLSYFYVELLEGQALQKITKEIKDEMGIKVRKVKKESRYKVDILDPSKYSATLKKYSHQAIENSEPDFTYSEPNPSQYETAPTYLDQQPLDTLDNPDTPDEESPSILDAYFESEKMPEKAGPDFTHSEPHPSQHETASAYLDQQPLDTLDNPGTPDEESRRIEDAYFEDAYFEDAYFESEKISEEAESDLTYSQSFPQDEILSSYMYLLHSSPDVENQFAQDADVGHSPITTPHMEISTSHQPFSSPTLFNHQFNAQRSNTFVSPPTPHAAQAVKAFENDFTPKKGMQ